MLLIIFNAIFVVIAMFLLGWMMRTTTKFDWAFGDDPVRDRLAYIFLRLMIVLIAVGLLAAIVNIVLLYAE